MRLKSILFLVNLKAQNLKSAKCLSHFEKIVNLAKTPPPGPLPLFQIPCDTAFLTTRNRGQEAEVARRQNYKLGCSARSVR